MKQIFIVALLVVFVYSCSENSNESGPASISVKLMDNPGDYDAVNIEVIDVRYKQSDDDGENGWESLDPINTGVYNLLELTGGLNVLLVDDFQIPAGELNQIRLVLGENNEVVIDEETFPLKTPSAQQSGLKLKVNETLEPNISYTFLLDFMVNKSIVMAGNSGNIILKPVINASVEANSGALSGIVSPVDVAVLIEVWIEGVDEIVTSTTTNEAGEFLIVGLNDNQTYTITITPAEGSGYLVTELTEVAVEIGVTKDLGTIELVPE